MLKTGLALGRAVICCKQALVGAVYFNMWSSTGTNNVAFVVFLDVTNKIQAHAFVVVPLLIGRAVFVDVSLLREMNFADGHIATLCQKRFELALKSLANATGIDVWFDKLVLVCIVRLEVGTPFSSLSRYSRVSIFSIEEVRTLTKGGSET